MAKAHGKIAPKRISRAIRQGVKSPRKLGSSRINTTIESRVWSFLGPKRTKYLLQEMYDDPNFFESNRHSLMTKSGFGTKYHNIERMLDNNPLFAYYMAGAVGLTKAERFFKLLRSSPTPRSTPCDLGKVVRKYNAVSKGLKRGKSFAELVTELKLK
jgi:hypothetical protein